MNFLFKKKYLILHLKKRYSFVSLRENTRKNGSVRANAYVFNIYVYVCNSKFYIV